MCDRATVFITPISLMYCYDYVFAIFWKVENSLYPVVAGVACGAGREHRAYLGQSTRVRPRAVILPFCKGRRSRNVTQPWPVAALV